MNKFGVGHFWGNYISKEKQDTEETLVVFKSGIKKKYKNGKLHSSYGPAVEYPNGDVEYYKEGLLHREGGPAVIKGGYIEYRLYGALHRINGPAIIYPGGLMKWYINNELIKVDNRKVDCNISKQKI